MAHKEKIPTEAQLRATEAKPEYLEWLHALTLEGYKYDLMISADHREVLWSYFVTDTPPEKAIEQYKKFLIRWKALHEPGGDLYGC